MRRALLAALALLPLTAPAAARADIVISIANNELRATASTQGEANALRVVVDNGGEDLEFYDDGPGVVLEDDATTGSNCAPGTGSGDTPPDANAVRCDISNLNAFELEIDLKDGTNSAVVARGSGGNFGDIQYSGGTGCDTYDGSQAIRQQSASLGDAPGGCTQVAIGGPLQNGLVGGSGRDDLRGGPVNDNLTGLGGDDILSGGPGNDGALNGGAGVDTVLGGDGNDGLLGGDGSDTLRGEAGDDTLDGQNDGDALVSGGDGEDTVNGGPGNDTLAGDNDEDTINGGDGDDTTDGGPGIDTISGNGGNDPSLHGGEQDDIISGGAGNDGLFGDNGDDTLAPGDDADSSFGGPGDDSIADSKGPDLIDGGEGTIDAIAYGAYAPEGPVTLSLNGAADDGRDGEGDNLVAMESLTGTPAGDVISGDAGVNYLNGGDGGDRIDGGLGIDILRGQYGDDIVIGRDDQLQRDDVGCNEGAGDTAVLDANDRVASDCEAVDRAAPPAGVDVSKLGPAGLAPATTGPGQGGVGGDTTAPSVTLRGVPGRISKGVLRTKGFTISVGVDEAAALDVRILGTAKRATVSAVRDLVLAQRNVARGSGTRRIKLKPNAKLLGRGSRLKLRVVVVATDAAGNRRTVTRALNVAPKKR